MRLSVNQTTLPRLHLLGTLALVLLVTLSLVAFFSWRNERAQQASLEHLSAAVSAQQRQRLQAEVQSAMGYIEFLHHRTESVLRGNLMEQVDAAYAVAQAIYERESALRPAQEVQQLIIEALRPMRFFDGRGYIFIDTMQGDFVLLPTAPEYEGRLGIDNRDDMGVYIMQGLIKAAQQPVGKGFFQYRWYPPEHPKQMRQKTAYVRHFAPYDWLIGTGDYLHEWEQRQQQEALQRLRALRFGSGGAMAVMTQQGQLLLSPSSPSLERLTQQQLPLGKQRALAQIHASAQAGGGLLEYDWPQSGALGEGSSGRKTAQISTYAPWGWILIATMFNDELEAATKSQAQAWAQDRTRQRFELIFVILATLALGMLGSLGFSRWSQRLFASYHQELQQAHENLRVAAIAFQSQEGMLVTNQDGVVLRVNQSFTAITGYSGAQAVGRSALELLQSSAHPARFYQAIAHTLATTGAWSGEFYSEHKDGKRYPLWATATAVRQNSGRISHYVCTLVDITERKAAEEEIRRLAFYDSLTALPNRRLLRDRLQQAMRTSASTQRYGALIFLDLDNFKLVNDSLGHSAGDKLLQTVAQRLHQSMRDGDTVARLGGDEFVIVSENLSAEPDSAALEARALAEQVLDTLAQPLSISGKPVQNTCSMGVVLFLGRQHSSDELMKHADLAMYQAKESGRNTVRFFDPDMHAKVVQRLHLEQALREALESSGQLLLYYQPQVDAEERIVGAEALVRWQHPEKGMVSPGEFIPLAEETGLILPLGSWVLNTACQQLAQWAQQPQTQAISLAVNISERQLQQDDFVEQVLQALQRSGAPAQQLKLEITESLLMQEPEQAIAKMRILQAHGLRFSLDDFGTGYSSMAYLRQLPLYQIKIDQSFVRQLDSDPRSAAIVRAMVMLAESLGMQTIAEGVETPAQRQALADNGCLYYQGYLFGRPAPQLPF